MLKLNPPLKWAGGKRWLVPHIEPLWQKYGERRYVEPFSMLIASASINLLKKTGRKMRRRPNSSTILTAPVSTVFAASISAANSTCRSADTRQLITPATSKSIETYFGDGHSRTEILRSWRSNLMISSTRTHPTTSSSRPTAPVASHGTIKLGPPNCWRSIADQLCFQIRRQIGS